MMSDYESGFRKAMRIVYPKCVLKGCYFHFTQAVRRKSRKIPYFFNTVCKNEGMLKIYHKLMGMALLPHCHIKKAFNDIKKEVAALKSPPFNIFLAYFERQWINLEGPKSFSVYGLDSRTNNLVESHNSQLSTSISEGSNFFTVIAKLLDDEMLKSHSLNLVLSGRSNVYRPPAKVYVDRSNEIKKMEKNLRDKLISPMQFLDALTNPLNKNVNTNMANFETGNVSDIEEEEEDVSMDTLTQILALSSNLPSNARKQIANMCDRIQKN